MILSEILNSKFTNFKEDYDEKYHIYETEAKIGKRTIHFYADWKTFEDGEKHAEIEFSESDISGSARKYSLTGSGDEFAVLSFIKQSIQQFIKLESPDRIMFSANKSEELGSFSSSSSRASVYKKLFTKYLKTYDLDTVDIGNKVKFKLEKK